MMILRAAVVLCFVLQGAGGAGPSQRLLTRRPLQKTVVELKAPTGYSWRTAKPDLNTGEPIRYDPMLRVEPTDVKAGKYNLRWIGYDGGEKSVTYQRPDTVDIVVRVSVEREAKTGEYIYSYVFTSLPTSGEVLSFVALQTFCTRIVFLNDPDRYLGKMGKHIPLFSEGTWLGLDASYFDRSVDAGSEAEVRFKSPAPPGMVGCRAAGGKFGYSGAGEEMPAELESVMLGFEAWPQGSTLGPVDSLRQLSSGERRQYLTDHLTDFAALGWATEDAISWFRGHLVNADKKELMRMTEEYHSRNAITSEVAALIEYTL